MPLQYADINPGVIACFDEQRLHADPEVITNYYQAPVFKNRPYVCYGVDRWYSLWAPLTTQPRPDRLWLPPHWFICTGSVRLPRRAMYLLDGGNALRAPMHVAVAAAQDDLIERYGGRRFLSPDGLAAVINRLNLRVGPFAPTSA